MTPTIAAYLRRDVRLARAHPAGFLLDALTMLFTAITFAMVAKVVSPQAVPGTYLTFAMTGLALGTLLGTGITVLSSSVRDEQVQGTLEAVVTTGLRPRAIAAGMAAYPLASATVRTVVYVAIAAVLGARAPGANWPLAVTATLLGAISFAGVGLVAAAAALLVRQSATITAWLVSLAGLAAGTLFPQRLLPGWVQAAAEISPFTHALDAVRAAVLSDASWIGEAGRLGVLAALAVVWVAAGIGALSAALRYGRRTGKLSRF